MPTDSILVIGAGELGTAVLEGLAKHPDLASSSSSSSSSNITLSVMIRPSSLNGGATADPAKQRHHAYLRDALRVSRLVPGDIGCDSAEELAEAFRPFDTIICCAGFGDAFPAGTQLKIARAVLLAAAASTSSNNEGGRKRKRFLPWQWGMDYDAIGTGSAQDLFDEQLQVRALLRAETKEAKKEAATVDWVIVSTGLFMSFLFRADFGVVDLPRRTVRCLGGWDTRITVTTPRDIGVMAAEIALRPGGISNRVVYVAGDTVSYARVAELVEERFGSGAGEEEASFKREAWDREFLRRELTENPGDVMLKYRNCFAEGRGVAFDMEDTVNKQRGIVLQDVQSYLKEMEL